ncbi:alpha/beta fold hydrolase [Roseisolibacter sp. H3M3-2]|uniref:alpha/beta fold hydrolase n=1 Tax=Roseisolibacter sp. H3M3-2 TaxID=3031323 RepID=UPI0023DA30A9|nr:alpha/beta fold hydrolase [Roseisolibacter sp. H3M3-2]MDF1504439.1 alpha/beta fold hydrolase [Roseisolibacter sp. H3M3-2]
MTAPVYLLHGALGARDTLHPLEVALRPLLVAGTPVRTHEFPGHGATPDPDGAPDAPLDVARLAAGVLDALDRDGADRATLFGYSMGGYVALLLAAQHPARVRAVVTHATKLAWTPEGAAREASRLDPATLRAKVPRFADALAARRAGAGGWEPLLARTAAMMHAIAARAAVTPEVLAGVACPARLCVGDRDATVSLEETAAAARALPKGELAVLPNTGHPLEAADPARLAREVAELHARAAV